MERIGIFRSVPSAHGGHAFPGGTISRGADSRGVDAYDEGAKIAEEAVAAKVKTKAARRALRAPKMTRDMASPVAAVMLHLRSCYVSKAAILTVPVLLVPVENRSPA
jgi:hypothetical protein